MEWTDVNILVAPCKTTYMRAKTKCKWGRKKRREGNKRQMYRGQMMNLKRV